MNAVILCPVMLWMRLECVAKISDDPYPAFFGCKKRSYIATPWGAQIPRQKHCCLCVCPWNHPVKRGRWKYLNVFSLTCVFVLVPMMVAVWCQKVLLPWNVSPHPHNKSGLFCLSEPNQTRQARLRSFLLRAEVLCVSIGGWPLSGLTIWVKS